MRHLPLVLGLLIVLVIGSGCRDDAPKRAAHYSAPSVSPVREKITSAQTSLAGIASAAAGAKLAITKAQAIASAPATATSAADLHEELGEAYGLINDLQTKADSAKSATADAQTAITTLETKVGTQTTDLNECSDQKNQLIDQVRDLKAAAVIHDRKYHRLKFAVCSLITAAAVFLAVKLGALKLASKAMLLGPWGIAGAAAAAIALPTAIFAFLWFKL
jgi:predicted  nucleic acid-binding Zn-ribbon protein